MATLFCNRPHPNAVDYNTARFVVSTCVGLNVNGQKLEMGDLVPQGVLSEYALRCEYERPPGRIELLEYSLSDPELREACARRGMDVTAILTEAVTPTVDPNADALRDLEKLDRKELVKLCEQSGIPTNGTRKQLYDRIAALLG